MFKKKSHDLKNYLNYIIIGDFAVSSDGSHVAYAANTTGNSEMWLMNTKEGWHKKLTDRGQNIEDISFVNNDERIVFCSDIDGNEEFSIFLTSQDGKEEKKLLGEDGYTFLGPEFCGDGRKLIYVTNKYKEDYITTHIRDLESKEERCFFVDNANTFVSDYTEDLTGFLLYALYNNSSQKIFYRNMKNDEEIQISGHSDEPYSCLGATFLEDVNKVIYVSTESSRYSMYIYDLLTGRRQLFHEFDMDIFSYEVSCDKKILSVILENGLSSKLKIFNLETMKELPLNIENSVFSKVKFSKDSRKLIFKGGKDITPENLYMVDLNDFSVEKLTETLPEYLSEKNMVEPIEIYYESYDNLKIPSLLYLKKEWNEGDKGPMLVWIHGGPHLCEKRIYNGMYQYLLAEGFSIFCPNFRGSAGFGMSFMKLAEKDWGNGPRKDILCGIDWLVKEGYARKEDIVVGGSSFGGYLSLLIAGRHPEYCKGTLDFFGPSDLLTFIESAPDYWKESFYDTIGHPEKDKEMLEGFSPINYVSGIKSPVMIVQGEMDPRVKKEESYKIYRKIKSKGINVEYILLENEGHGITRPENKETIIRKLTEFLQGIFSAD